MEDVVVRYDSEVSGVRGKTMRTSVPELGAEEIWWRRVSRSMIFSP